jgi:TolA-binding protein
MATATPPPVAIQQIEQQQATIARLENEIAAARERLNRERLENEIRSAEEKRTADAIRQAQLKKIEELQNIPVSEASARPVNMSSPSIPVNTPPVAAGVQTVSVTTDREQSLYRSAVTAYKTGNCSESIKTFDAFTKAYPDSPFKSDAAYYRNDCADRITAAAPR